MAKWQIPTEKINLKFPQEILQEYASDLTNQTQEKLQGQVKEDITYLQNDSPRITHTLLVYILRLKQHYRLFELTQSSENPYPVSLTAFYYTGSEIFDNLTSPTVLDQRLSNLVTSAKVGNILAHFLRLSELSEYRLSFEFEFDFKTFASLGNIYNSSVPNNLSDFKSAETIYNAHKNVIIESVKETLDFQPGGPIVGSRIQIPVAHLQSDRLITALIFLITKVEGNSLQLSLAEVIKSGEYSIK